MTGSSWPASPTTTPTPIQRKWRYVAIDKDESQIHHVFFQEAEEDVDNNDIQEATGVDSCFLNFDLICILSFFGRLKILQVESSNIEVLPNESENGVNTKKGEIPNML